MKKIGLIILSIGILFFTGCGNSLYDKYKAVNKGNYKTYQNITYDEYVKKIDDKDTFILFIWQTGCSHCEDFEPKLNEIIKYYGLEIYGLNLKDLDEEQYAKLKNKTFVTGTPATVYFKDGAYESKLVGDKSEEEIIKFLVDSNYLEEK